MVEMLQVVTRLGAQRRAFRRSLPLEVNICTFCIVGEPDMVFRVLLKENATLHPLIEMVTGRLDRLFRSRSFGRTYQP
jgi:hypothetical protein